MIDLAINGRPSSIVAGSKFGLKMANVMVALAWPTKPPEAGLSSDCTIEAVAGALAVHVTFRFTTGVDTLKVNELAV